MTGINNGTHIAATHYGLKLTKINKKPVNTLLYFSIRSTF